MKKVLLILIISVVLLGLLPIQSCAAKKVTEINIEDFVGTWLNVDKKTGNITKIVIAEADDCFSVEFWGKCEPEDCYWGIQYLAKKEIIEAKGMINLVWEKVFAITESQIELLKPTRIELTNLTTFTTTYTVGLITILY